MIFYENHLPADDSHEISCLFFRKSSRICNCRLLQITGGALWVISPENGEFDMHA